jgi:membrane associated rhomboid family serine protease
MSSPYSSELESPRLTRAVLWLIALNVAIYFLQITVQEDLPARLGFKTSDFAERSWWTLVTYMFVHAGLWHLALNMYMLWAFGPRVERSWSTAGFTWYYLWCGLGGVLFHFMLASSGGLLIGASAAVFGVLLAYAVRWPNDEVYLFGVVPMKMKWLVPMYVAIDLVSGMSRTAFSSGGIAHFAHIGGVVFGGLYLLRPTAPSVDRLRQRVSQAPDVSDDPPRAVPRSLPRPRERGSEADEAVEKSKAVNVTTRPAPPRPAPAATVPRTAELDLVLDKISQHGLESLTREERTLLEEMSKRLRSRD